jgi:hypothetical protein
LVAVLFGEGIRFFRPNRHRANRTGTHEGRRGPWGNASSVPRRQVATRGGPA